MQAGLLICAALAVCIVLPVPVTAREHRSAAVKREFQLTHPCPATGLTSRRCPGYVNDHIVPLACGGPDAVSNMQWQSIREARAKDKWESDSEGVKAGSAPRGRVHKRKAPSQCRWRRRGRGRTRFEPEKEGLPEGSVRPRPSSLRSSRAIPAGKSIYSLYLIRLLPSPENRILPSFESGILQF